MGRFGSLRLWRVCNRRGAESAERGFVRALWSFCLVFALLFWGGEAVAGPLAERLACFPNWDKPLVGAAVGDLVYPDWMAGTWQVRSTLVDLVAPLAPDVVTPGFEGNRRYLNQPITFQVRFAQARLPRKPSFRLVPRPVQQAVVADRAFNGLNLARAYLGDRSVLAVMVDPSSPNRQVTLLRDNRQLVSVVTGRATETPAVGQFITTEVFQQLFRGTRSQAKTAIPYFNQVETTTAYRLFPTSDPTIEADQVTAVYLSPQDPSYFAAGSRPVALYRYRLEFFKGVEETPTP